MKDIKKIDIKQNTSVAEPISSADFKVLVNLCDNNASRSKVENLEGTIYVPAIYRADETKVNNVLGSKGLSVEYGSYYIDFEDPILVQVLSGAVQSSDTVGITEAQAASKTFPTSVSRLWFNPEHSSAQTLDDASSIKYLITSFKELAKLTRVTGLGGANSYYTSSYPTGTFGSFGLQKNLTDIDLKNITAIPQMAFAGDVNLKHIGDLSKITSIAAGAFNSCPIEDIMYLPSCEYIGYPNNSGNTTTHTQVRYGAFNMCKTQAYILPELVSIDSCGGCFHNNTHLLLMDFGTKFTTFSIRGAIGQNSDVKYISLKLNVSNELVSQLSYAGEFNNSHNYAWILRRPSDIVNIINFDKNLSLRPKYIFVPDNLIDSYMQYYITNCLSLNQFIKPIGGQKWKEYMQSCQEELGVSNDGLCYDYEYVDYQILDLPLPSDQTDEITSITLIAEGQGELTSNNTYISGEENAIVGNRLENKVYFRIKTGSPDTSFTLSFEELQEEDSSFVSLEDNVLSITFPESVPVENRITGVFGLKVRLNQTNNTATFWVKAYDYNNKYFSFKDEAITKGLFVWMNDGVGITDTLRNLFKWNGFNTFRNSTTIQDFSDLDKLQGITALTATPVSSYSSSVGNFENCVNLKKINCANITAIGAGTFSGCSSLEDLGDTSNITNIGLYAFKGCTKLFANSSLYFPNVIYLGGNQAITYSNSTLPPKIKRLILPKCTQISPTVCCNNSILHTVILPSAEELKWVNTGEGYPGQFQGCTSLNTVILGPNWNIVHHKAFSGCNNINYFVSHSLATTRKGNNEISFGGNSTVIFFPQDATDTSWLSSSMDSKKRTIGGTEWKAFIETKAKEEWNLGDTLSDEWAAYINALKELNYADYYIYGVEDQIPLGETKMTLTRPEIPTIQSTE